MSVTIQQRLHEMSLVHQMLRAAMTEDGDEDDETKEQYGSQMDENFAALKAKLEQAKADEGLESPENLHSAGKPSVNGGADLSLLSHEATSRQAHGDPTENRGSQLKKHHSDLNGKSLSESEGLEPQESATEDNLCSEEKEATLFEQLEGIDVSAMDDISDSELRIAKLEVLKAQSDYEDLQAAKRNEINDLQLTVDSLTSALHNIQEADQSKDHDIRHLRYVNEVSKEKYQQLQQEKAHQRDWHQELLKQIEETKDRLQNSAEEEALIGQQATRYLESEILRIQEAKQREEAHAQEAIGSLQDRIRHMHEEHRHEMSCRDSEAEILATQTQQREDLRIEVCLEHKQLIASLRQDIEELQASKQRELNHEKEAFQSMQNELREVHETKERELDDLIQQHTEALAIVHQELDEARKEVVEESEVKDVLALQLDSLGATLESSQADSAELRRASDKLRSRYEEIRGTLGFVHASSVELRRTLDELKTQHMEEISQVKSQVKDLKTEKTGLDTILEEQGGEQMTKIKDAVDTALGSFHSTERAFEEAFEETSYLAEQLAIREDEESDLIARVTQAEAALAAANKLQDQSRQESKTSSTNPIEATSERDFDRKHGQTLAAFTVGPDEVEEIAAVFLVMAEKVLEENRKKDVELQDAQSKLDALPDDAPQSSVGHEEAEIEGGVKNTIGVSSVKVRTASEELHAWVRSMHSDVKAGSAASLPENANQSMYSDRTSPEKDTQQPLGVENFENGRDDKGTAGEDLSSRIQEQV
ncbi:MAG: hypothetical protein Q9220_000561 [cf. Caloplaca sp. 1 TL-2023]